jgi:hypothetical protein
MTEAQEAACADSRPAFARRVFASLVRGIGLDAIGAEEKVSDKTVQATVQEEFDRRRVPAIADFAKLQIARLENLAQRLSDSIERAELEAFDRMLKIIDRLDRYHGFTRASPAAEPYGEEERARLLAKINAIADRMDDQDARETPAG